MFFEVLQHLFNSTIVFFYVVQDVIIGRTLFYRKLIVSLCRGIKATIDDGSVTISLNVTGVVNKTLHVLCPTVGESVGRWVLPTRSGLAVASTGLWLWFIPSFIIKEAQQFHQRCHR